MNESPAEQTRPISNRDAERLQTLYVVNDMLKQVVAEGLGINTILPRVMLVALEEVNAFSGSIIVVNETLDPQYAWIMTGDQLEENDSPFIRKIVQEGLIGWAMEHQQTGIIANTRDDERWLPRPDHPTAREPWSAICSPLIVRSRAVGAITMTRPGLNQFDQRTADLLEAIANQAATTIESARLYEESQRRADELAALVSATAAVTTSLELEEVLRDVAEQMVNLTQADVCTIFDWDRGNNLLAHRITYPETALDTWRDFPTFNPEEYPTVRQVLTNSESLQIHRHDRRISAAENAFLERTETQAALLLPLVAHEQTIGLAALLDVQRHRPYTQQEIDFAQMLASQAAIAIQNARLYEDTQRQLRVSALLNEASKVINSSLDTNQILQSLLAQMNELLNAEAISIALVDQQNNELVYEVAEGIGSEKIVGLRLPSNQGVSGWVMEHGEPALVPDMSQDPRFYREGDRRTGHNTRAMICAPLQVKDEVLGTVQAINPRQGTFTENDLQLLVNLANLASSALANAQQFTRTQAAEARYLSLFEDSVNPILLTDPDGYVVEANRRAVEILGYDYDELLGLPLRSLHKQSEGTILPALNDNDQNQVKTFNGEIRTKEGLIIPVEVYAKRTLSGDSELLQWIYRDITHQVELEEMRSDMMAMLVHDLQSPLGNVISSLELMRYELPEEGDPVLASIVDIASRSSRRLQTLIRSLLDISHLEAGHPLTDMRFAEIAGLLEEAQKIIEPTLERRRATLMLAIPDDIPPVYVDSDMIGRVFINLLDNASKYTPEGKELTITAQPTGAPNGTIQISVSDQGQGIPPRYREVIFEKFRRIQGKDAPKGLGLGLAFCRLAVEAHGGTIWVDDAPGGGARFNFTLPTHPFTPEGQDNLPGR